MELVPTLISTGWTSGVNAYLTVALLSLLGRAGVGEVPESLQSDGVLIGALVMYAIEFVVDKVPYLDDAWDVVHTAVRPAIASALGISFAGDAEVGGLDEILSGGGSGGMALASHAVKAGLRLGVNSSPEPFSNILVSLVEDSVAASVVVLALHHPVEAAVIAVVLLALGVGLLVLLAARIRRALRRLREHRGRPPPA